MKEASGVSPFFKKTVDPGNLLCFEFPRLFLVICFRIFSSQAQLLLFIAWLVPWGKCWGAVSGMILECCLVTKRKTRVEEISNLNMGRSRKGVFWGWVKIGWNYPYRWGRPGGLAIDISQAARFHQWRRKPRTPVCNILLMDKILHQLIGSLSHYLQGFIHTRRCRISSINSITSYLSNCNLVHQKMWRKKQYPKGKYMPTSIAARGGGGSFKKVKYRNQKNKCL